VLYVFAPHTATQVMWEYASDWLPTVTLLPTHAVHPALSGPVE
jgi:hypothetical protein